MGALRHRVFAGCLAWTVLLLGALVYVLDRPSETAWFVGPVSLADLGYPLFGAIGQNLPTFAHAFAFSVLTGLMLTGGRKSAARACIVWLAVDAGFEAGQHPAIGTLGLAWWPDGIDAGVMLQPIRAYFHAGTFDPLDVLSIIVGAATAYVLLRWALVHD